MIILDVDLFLLTSAKKPCQKTLLYSFEAGYALFMYSHISCCESFDRYLTYSLIPTRGMA
jgi:hypothetical protein